MEIVIAYFVWRKGGNTCGRGDKGRVCNAVGIYADPFGKRQGTGSNRAYQKTSEIN